MSATAVRPRLTLHAETAADLMTENPVSIRENASVQEAVRLFTKKGFSAAPVIDAAGRPVGVLSSSDLIVREGTDAEWDAEGLVREERETDEEEDHPTAVAEMMTPAVFCVSPDCPVTQVVHEMLSLRVHHVFVVDADGVLVGVISALDVLRRLRL